MNRDTDDAWRPAMLAYIAYRRYGDAHPDLADFHRRRYEAYRELLGVGLDEERAGDPDHRALHSLLASFADQFSRLDSPFAGYLEAPKGVFEVYAAHSSAIRTHFAALENLYLDVMVDCANRLWGPCPHRVTAEELTARGVGREHEPDEFDYF